MGRVFANLRRDLRRIKAAGQRTSKRTDPPGFFQWSTHHLSGYFTTGFSSFHHWLSDRLDGLHLKRGSRLNVVAPRGAAKSTWSTLAYPLYVTLENLEPYVILTSDTSYQAAKYLEAIKAEIEDNESIAAKYPAVAGRGPVWRDDHIRLRNGVVIESAGTGQKLRGRKHRQHRPTLIIVDDPQNKDHIVSDLQRSRSWEWFTKDVCNAGSPETNIVVLGTALHREAIVCLLQTTAGWQSQVFQSIVEWPKRMDLWAKWQEIYCNYDLDADERERRSLAFYEQNKDAMLE